MNQPKEESQKRRKEMALLTQQGHSVSQIARMYGISRQAVSQLLQKAAKDGHKVCIRSHKNCIERSNYEYTPTKKELGIDKNCAICGIFFNTQSRLKKTCSKKCRRTLQSQNLIKAKGSLGNWSRYESVQLVCYNCGKSFERTKYRDSISKLGCGTKNSYCSRECFHEKTRELLEPSWPSFED